MNSWVYDTTSDPFQTPDGIWYVDILYFDDDGNMSFGSCNLPSLQVAQELIKYFRTNVTPLGDDDLSEFIAKHRKRILQ